ncbi:MAG: hypothetical protein K2H61_06530 [Muribaculaceae bacterium]|nr:hypothetical protein [Muribaculaceae bacterium]
MRHILTFISFALLAFGLTPNAEAKKEVRPSRINLELPTRANISSRYGNLDYGLRIQVNSDVGDRDIINLYDLPSNEAKSFPSVEMDNSLAESVEQYLDSYTTQLGFKVATNANTDYILKVTVKDFRVRVRNYNVKKKIYNSSAAMVINWELLDAQYKTVISSTTSTGRGSTRSSDILSPLSSAYTEALSNIDWDRIASALRVAKTARQEANKEVTGMGNTALEHSVIRWNIVSRPQGSDVYWRVVSSTPDVVNTNSNFVGTTPYESTESFDIKGLTYNNSGNVQIEVSCEKPGYVTQRKRFNLRQVIDQKEISAKFNLVKEDEE